MRLLKVQIQIMEERALKALKDCFDLYPTEEQKALIKNSLRVKYSDFFNQEDNFIQSYQALRKELDTFNTALERMSDTISDMKKKDVLPKTFYYVPSNLNLEDYTVLINKVKNNLYEKQAREMYFLRLLNDKQTRVLIQEVIYTADTRKKNFDQVLKIVIDECIKKIKSNPKHYFKV